MQRSVFGRIWGPRWANMKWSEEAESLAIQKQGSHSDTTLYDTNSVMSSSSINFRSSPDASPSQNFPSTASTHPDDVYRGLLIRLMRDGTGAAHSSPAKKETSTLIAVCRFYCICCLQNLDHIANCSSLIQQFSNHFTSKATLAMASLYSKMSIMRRHALHTSVIQRTLLLQPYRDNCMAQKVCIDQIAGNGEMQLAPWMENYPCPSIHCSTTAHLNRDLLSFQFIDHQKFYQNLV